MNTTLSSFSEEQLSAILVVATVVVLLAWNATTLDGISRITTAGLAGVVASAAMVAGLHVLE
ncbi:hypothetical protein [Halorubellus salinus]|uniref:hypothetical protein n=1 Tax=Halorubellus salinus TaxID=755309 RepID=UPI001D08BE60|nr:hypothetical protein [Halorubellus salinus]